MDFIQMEGKHILVSGGTSGIGQTTAILLSELGAKVVIVSRREEKLQETLAKMAGNGHCYFAMDMAEVNTLESRIKEIVEQTGTDMCMAPEL